jgi:hypothetical protein
MRINGEGRHITLKSDMKSIHYDKVMACPPQFSDVTLRLSQFRNIV